MNPERDKSAPDICIYEKETDYNCKTRKETKPDQQRSAEMTVRCFPFIINLISLFPYANP